MCEKKIKSVLLLFLEYEVIFLLFVIKVLIVRF